jgi:phosphoribosylaminoimidazole-succinocarboxamide synthase
MMLGRRLSIVPVECVVRGHLAGSAWKSYSATGHVQGVRLPSGLREGEELEQPLFTPTTKAAAGHDQPLTPGEAVALLGEARYLQLREASLAVFQAGRAWGARAGLLLADTKFEFGFDAQGVLTLADEVFTPDSSRWWDAAGFVPGASLPGFDKQFVRDFLLAQKSWDQRAPAPDLPAEVVEGTRTRYLEAWKRLSRAG